MDRTTAQESQAFPIQVVKISSELLSSKCIDKGIEATVDKCNCLSHIEGQFQIPFRVTIGKEFIEIECLQENHNVVRCPEEEKHHDHQKDKFNGFSFLVVFAGNQCPRDSEVTVTHNEHGQQEAKNICFHVAEHGPDILQDLGVVPQAFIFLIFGEHELGCCHQDGCCPDA